ncbi:ABC transporter permease [Ferviditalea candida]|uniref:ABC transporter permease n=1 Tax=Ferviditalea candida TaxID=3108399 RepID=A0ABU5ZH21_9BACL|nr:ABC transporter permease [Paenibacillaceae bacterium T2]
MLNKHLNITEAKEQTTTPKVLKPDKKFKEEGFIDKVLNFIRARKGLSTKLLLAPGVLWMVLFLIVPLLAMIYVSFWTQSSTTIKPIVTTENYKYFFSSTVYLSVLWNTVKIWLIVLISTLVLGYPVAFFISQMVRSERMQTVLLLICIIPFWTSFLIRVLAWKPMLGIQGALNIVLEYFHIINHPIEVLLYSEFGMILGMIQIYVVFMVGPIAFSLGRIDHNLVEAAQDLGASFLQIFRDIYWPLSKPGVIAGSIFVTVMVLGEFAIPAALGGKKVNLLGNIILTQVGSLKWAFASVVGVVLTIVIAIAVSLLLRVVNLRKQI